VVRVLVCPKKIVQKKPQCFEYEVTVALCIFKTARVTAEPTTMPIRHADTTKIAARFAFICSIRFNLNDSSDYEKKVS
jgi:hypothetical protein